MKRRTQKIHGSVRRGIAAVGDCLRSSCCCCVTPTVSEGSDPLKKISRRIVLLVAAVVSTALCAMPTQEELSKAGPLIQELMRDDLTAIRNGKKTREQVGDTAVALAREAQSPAEKYLLLTAAFDHYMRGGSYDKANSSLADLRSAIPDWKHSDEYALIEKSLRVLATGKGGPVRERYMALKERQQYAAKLKKALAQAKAKPADKKLQLQVAAYYAVLEYWPQAIDAFIAGSNPACAAAAKLEKESAAPGQIADAWWSASDVNPEFLSVAIRAHAADLYKKAIAANALAGLQKVAAEKRIAEAESAATESVSEPIAASYGAKKNPYVTKGLVAMWDGEWNAGLGKHDAKASKWKDLVGKSDCDPVGTPKFSGNSVELDGNSCWNINPSPELLKAVLNPSMTCEVVLKFGKGAISANEGFIGFGKNNSRVLWGYAGGAPMSPNASIAFQHKGSPPPVSWKPNDKVEATTFSLPERQVTRTVPLVGASDENDQPAAAIFAVLTSLLFRRIAIGTSSDKCTCGVSFVPYVRPSIYEVSALLPNVAVTEMSASAQLGISETLISVV